MASYLEIDAVIDPADTRRWIMEGLKAAPAERTEKAGHDFVDTW
jgi:acetyl-CoA carboxylase carboxyltransferase component